MLSRAQPGCYAGRGLKQQWRRGRLALTGGARLLRRAWIETQRSGAFLAGCDCGARLLRRAWIETWGHLQAPKLSVGWRPAVTPGVD